MVPATVPHVTGQDRPLEMGDLTRIPPRVTRVIECDVCGGAVVNYEKHRRFHQFLEGSRV